MVKTFIAGARIDITLAAWAAFDMQKLSLSSPSDMYAMQLLHYNKLYQNK
jgi:hypothetical protein